MIQKVLYLGFHLRRLLSYIGLFWFFPRENEAILREKEFAEKVKSLKI